MKNIKFILILVLFFSFLISHLCETKPLFAQSTTNPVDTLEAGQWYEVPNSKIRSVLPSPIPPGNGPGSIVKAWSGGAYDTARDRFIVWGGGHNDYGGNEIYTFGINTLSWTRIWGPSPNVPSTGGACVEIYADGNPVSRHTYNGLEYLPVTDEFWGYGGSLYCGSGSGSMVTWTFNLKNSVWSRRADVISPGSWTELEAVSAYDPVTKHVFMTSPSLPLYEYDPVANTWTQRSNSNIGYGRVAVIDPVRREFLILGRGEILYYNLTPTGTLTLKTLATTGDTSILGATSPGIAYDPASDKLVAWNGGADVYVLDRDKLIWTRTPPAPSNTVVPSGAAPNGTFGRWRYVPSKNVFIGVNSIDENVWIYKLSPGAGTPIDTTPPTQPRELRLQ